MKDWFLRTKGHLKVSDNLDCKFELDPKMNKLMNFDQYLSMVNMCSEGIQQNSTLHLNTQCKKGLQKQSLDIFEDQYILNNLNQFESLDM